MINQFKESTIKKKKESLLRNLQYNKSSYKIDFTSNSYLNLHEDSRVVNKSIEYIKKYGTSFCVSPLIGKCELYDELFCILEQIYKKKALVFSSGYQLNSTVIPAILRIFDNPIVFFDKLNHASMNHGLLLSKKQFHRYRNCDLNHLESLLKKYQNSNRKMFVFTESIFSMDGTMIDVKKIIYLKKQYNFFLYIDEAHALGVYGQNGYGLSHEYIEEVDIIMGTFSKGIGSQGAFIAVNNDLFYYLVNFCNGLIYSTGLAPANIGASYEAFKILCSLDSERDKINNIVQYMCNRLNLKNHQTHIIPIIFNHLEEAENIYQNLQNNKINTSLIKYPTVSRDSSRHRIRINSNHQIDDVNLLYDHLSC